MAVIAGGSGLVGSACLRLLLNHPAYSRVIAVVRRKLDGADHERLEQPERLEQIVTPLDNLGALPAVRAHHAFCALGTTRRKAGSKEAFRIVDHDLVVNFAYWARSCGADSFSVVSAVGADPESRVFYLRVKGEMEEAVREQWFPCLDIFRPALLEGDRQESRSGERIFAAACRLFNPLCRGPLARYHSIAASDVARGMIQAAQRQTSGARIHHYPEILDLAKATA